MNGVIQELCRYMRNWCRYVYLDLEVRLVNECGNDNNESIIDACLLIFKHNKHEEANAAMDDSSNDSGSEFYALLRDLSVCLTEVQQPSCSIDWSDLSLPADIIAAATSCLPYFFDSGATSHCSPNQADFSQLQPISTRQVHEINSSAISAIAIGNIHLRCGKGWWITLKDTLNIPDTNLCLISVGHLGDADLEVTFNATQCTIFCRFKTIAQGMRQGTGLCQLTEPVSVEHMNVAHTIPDLETWHWCLGHVNYDSIIQMAEKRLVKGMPTSLAYLLQICEDCILSKQT